jgi:hypothetical protein
MALCITAGGLSNYRFRTNRPVRECRCHARYEPGWNVTPVPVQFQYAPFGNPPDMPLPIPNTIKSFSNGTSNPCSFDYEAPCAFTIHHDWQITDGMTGNLVGTFRPIPGIDSGRPDTGIVHLAQSVSRDVPFSQHVSAMVMAPAMSSVTFQAFVDERPVTVPFEYDVEIGGSFRFEAFRKGGGIFPGQTRASFTMGLGMFY